MSQQPSSPCSSFPYWSTNVASVIPAVQALRYHPPLRHYSRCRIDTGYKGFSTASHQSNHIDMVDMITTVNPIPVLSLDILPVSCGSMAINKENGSNDPMHG